LTGQSQPLTPVKSFTPGDESLTGELILEGTSANIFLLEGAPEDRALFLLVESQDLPHASRLLKHLGPKIALYLVEADPRHRCLTLQRAGAGVSRAIRAVQRHGPYRVLGWAHAGMLAYETAIQLIGIDEAIEFLGMIETLPPAWLSRTVCLDAPGVIAGGDDAVPIQRSTAIAAQDYELDPQPAQVHWFGGGKSASAWPAETHQQLRTFLLPHDVAPHSELAGSGALRRSIAKALATVDSQHRSDEHRHRALCTIQSGRDGMIPFFCVPGAGSGPADFVPLTGELGEETPVHGFLPRGINTDSVPHSSVEAAAQAYLCELEQLYPNGSLHLVGHSFGGWIVFEMALLLQARGREVRSLTVLDSEVPAGAGKVGREYTRSEVLMQLVSLYEQVAQRTTGLTVADFATLLPDSQLSLLHQHVVRLGLMPARSQPASLRGTLRTFAAALRTEYMPSSTFLGTTQLVLVPESGECAAIAAARMTSLAAGWRRWAPNLRDRHERGNHFTLLKPPHIRCIAQWMSISREHRSPSILRRSNQTRKSRGGV